MMVFGIHSTLHAEETSDTLKEQVETLNQEVKVKRSRVKELEGLIGTYKERILQHEKKQTTLENEALLLDNRIRKKELDLERAKLEFEALELDLQAIEKDIEVQTRRVARQKELVEVLLRRIHALDTISPLEVLLTKRSLSAFFDRLMEMKRLEGGLADMLVKVKQIKRDLEGKKKEREEKKLALIHEKKRLKKEQLALETERNFKISFAAETRLKQSEFERALYELREQQQTAADDIATLETTLKEKLESIDEALARGDVLLNWPVDPTRGVTAHFHDSTYPFRHLFEHSGVDLRASVGSPVKAAAGGYVAWHKRGRLYGNYLMLIHPGGIATVYAHLSRFIAKPDTYVERGTIIAESGGRPGDPGAGLSSGPHLHFEVRNGGIPVNPENYLPSIPGGDELD